MYIVEKFTIDGFMGFRFCRYRELGINIGLKVILVVDGFCQHFYR